VDGHPPDESPDDGTGEPPSGNSREGQARPDASPDPAPAPPASVVSGTEPADRPEHDGEAPPGEPSPATAEEAQDDPSATAKDRTDDRPPVTANTPTAPEAPTPAGAGTGSSTPGSPGPGDPDAPTAPAAPSAPAAVPVAGAPGPEGRRPDQAPVAPAGDTPDSAGTPDDGADDDDSTVVLGGAGTAAQSPPPAPRLSPDAVAASTATRTTDPHGMRAVRARITPPAGTTRVGDAETGEPSPRHFRSPGAEPEQGERRRPTALLAAAPVLIVILLILAWAVDSAALSGQVVRNVEVGGRPVGGLGEASLPEVVSEIADDTAARDVRIVNGDQTYETTAGAIGLTVDEEATADAALDAGRKDSLFVRPFKWLGSFFGSRDVPVHYTVSEGTAALALAQLQGGNATAPSEPEVVLDPNTGEFTVRPGQEGVGINSQEVAAELPEVAEDDASGAIVVRADSASVQPQYTDEEATGAANRANEMTANGLNLKVQETTVRVEPAQLRTWITPPSAQNGFEPTANGERIAEDLPALFSSLPEPQDATWILGDDGRPRVREARIGVTCCNDDSAERIWRVLAGGQGGDVELAAREIEPETTTEEAEAWRINEPVGGSRAFQSGNDIPGPAPGFTTYFTAGEPRVTNIHRIADLVNGAVIPPDGTFSVNDHVGQRTAANGFVEAGAIRNGQHVPEIGGGVSQFATTTFNAAYFAGLDIVEYQAHSEWFSRYPRGREATMGHPAPDLKIHNNTPYGIMIRTSHTPTSVTVTLWSTPYITAAQTNSSESPAGPGCTTVITTRTRTWVDDGRTDTDTFRATYRNVAEIDCQGRPIPPAPEDQAAPGR
jgi:hypothetical protein